MVYIQASFAFQLGTRPSQIQDSPSNSDDSPPATAPSEVAPSTEGTDTDGATGDGDTADATDKDTNNATGNENIADGTDKTTNNAIGDGGIVDESDDTSAVNPAISNGNAQNSNSLGETGKNLLQQNSMLPSMLGMQQDFASFRQEENSEGMIKRSLPNDDDDTSRNKRGRMELNINPNLPTVSGLPDIPSILGQNNAGGNPPPPPAGEPPKVTLSNGEMYCFPTMDALNETSQMGNCIVNNLTVGHRFYGTVLFIGYRDITGLDLSEAGNVVIFLTTICTMKLENHVIDENSSITKN